MKTFTIAGLVAAGLGLAYVVHAATRSPGKGDTVRASLTGLRLVASGGPIPGAQLLDVATVLVTSSDDKGNLYGTILSIANPSGTVTIPASLVTAGAGSVMVRREAVIG
jgi:hypothetical protein